MKFIVLVAALLVPAGVWAGEVGTPNPGKAENTSAQVNLALADKGTGSDWTITPVDFQVTAHQIRMQEIVKSRLHMQITADLEQKIEDRLTKVLSL